MPTSADILLDTSAALALVMPSNPFHEEVLGMTRSLTRGMAGHALAEVYSVLTRLPEDFRLRGKDAALAIERAFPSSVALPPDVALQSVALFAEAGIAGGSVYDGLVGLAAKASGIPLLTCDRRAVGTYAALQVDFRLI